MAILAILAEERSITDANAPTWAQILTAFRRARLDVGADPGDWIGPAPRVTRTAVLGERFATRAAWLYGWPSRGPWQITAPQPELARALTARVDAELRAVSSGWAPTVALEYSEQINGPLTWWQSGDAAQTRTRDAFPLGASRLLPDQNPLGPDTADTSGAQALGQGIASAAGSIAQAVVVIGLGYLVVTALRDD